MYVCVHVLQSKIHLFYDANINVHTHHEMAHEMHPYKPKTYLYIFKSSQVQT